MLQGIEICMGEGDLLQSIKSRYGKGWSGAKYRIRFKKTGLQHIQKPALGKADLQRNTEDSPGEVWFARNTSFSFGEGWTAEEYKSQLWGRLDCSVKGAGHDTEYWQQNRYSGLLQQVVL